MENLRKGILSIDVRDWQKKIKKRRLRGVMSDVSAREGTLRSPWYVKASAR